MKILTSLICLFCYLFLNTVQAAPIYKIELLIFQNLDSTMQDNEQWQQGDSLPSQLQSIRVDQAEGVIRLLPDTALTLDQTRERLSSSGQYQVIYHRAWSQAVQSKEENIAAWVEIPGVFEGSINLFQKRYLHLDADLRFNSLEGVVSLKESRRLKQKELNYLDHPLYGVLIRVVRL